MPEVARPALLDGSFHHHLLHDRARMDAYARAVAAAVRPGDVVADIGSGSGILAWLAAKAGAARVLAVEANTHSYQALLRHVRRNGLEGRVVPVLADGVDWRPPGRVDVLLCELMETGLLHEPMAAVLRNVRAWPEPPREVVPRGATLLVEGVAMEDDFLGYRARVPGFRVSRPEPAATDRAAYARYDFAKEAPPERVEAAFRLVAARDARVSGLQLWTTTEVGPGVALPSSPAHCTPFVLPLEDALDVRAGDALEGELSYEFAYVAEPIRYELRRA